MLLCLWIQYPLKDQREVRSGYYTEPWRQSPVRVTAVLQQDVSRFALTTKK